MLEGEIRPGKKTEMGFEFVSSQIGIVESFWRFLIPELNISVPFLLVGNTADPQITLDRSHLNFKSLLIGKCNIFLLCGLCQFQHLHSPSVDLTFAFAGLLSAK